MLLLTLDPKFHLFSLTNQLLSSYNLRCDKYNELYQDDLDCYKVEDSPWPIYMVLVHSSPYFALYVQPTLPDLRDM